MTDDSENPKKYDSFEHFIADFEVNRMAAESKRKEEIRKQQQKQDSRKKLRTYITTGLGISASIVITFIFSPYFGDFISPPAPEIHVTDLNAKDGIVEGSKLVYSYEPRSLTPNGTKYEEFYLKVINTGDEDAHAFWIDVEWQPNEPWFDFQESFVIDPSHTTSCPQKKSYCTIELIPKESNSYSLQYNVRFDHKLIQELGDETPKLFFIYNYDEGKEQTIEVFVKFG